MSRIAYLVSDYYAPSHTFVRREVIALRALGVDIVAFSVQRGEDRAGAAKDILGRSPFAYIAALVWAFCRSEEHTSELQSLMRISYAGFCLKKKKTTK